MKELVERGLKLLGEPRGFVKFTGNRAADELLNDLDSHPHAFVIACVMDRQIKAERAWLIPHSLRERAGGFELPRIRAFSLPEVENLMTNPEPLHRFPAVMSRNLLAAAEMIDREYCGDASRIWSGEPSSAEVVFRLLQFPGVGPKIGTMAANILARQFKVRFSDYSSVDISPDVHVRRVFGRLGLSREEAPVEELVYRARAIYPQFPGILDFPVWEVGRQWCRPKAPLCPRCYLAKVCPTAQRNERPNLGMQPTACGRD